MPRDIEQLIETLRRAYPDVAVEQQRAASPDAEDAGVWQVRHPDALADVQVESSTGQVPFLIESDLAPPVSARTVADAARLVAARLGLALKG
jgi:hypothetical protein